MRDIDGGAELEMPHKSLPSSSFEPKTSFSPIPFAGCTLSPTAVHFSPTKLRTRTSSVSSTSSSSSCSVSSYASTAQSNTIQPPPPLRIQPLESIIYHPPPLPPKASPRLIATLPPPPLIPLSPVPLPPTSPDQHKVVEREENRQYQMHSPIDLTAPLRSRSPSPYEVRLFTFDLTFGSSELNTNLQATYDKRTKHLSKRALCRGAGRLKAHLNSDGCSTEIA